MRIVGRRIERPVAFSASGTLLIEGARFNDEIHRLPTGGRTLIRKGVYRFGSVDETSRAECDRVATAVALAARERG
jgi:hypothetical protein